MASYNYWCKCDFRIIVRNIREIVMRCIQVMGSDIRMDQFGNFDKPINVLPARCDDCGFPDLDHVPQPYYLLKGRTMSPNEMASAENGNFFVRDRIRKVLEMVAPGLCSFCPTCYKGTDGPTPWYLAVANNQIAVFAKVKSHIVRCDTCDEPHSAHYGSECVDWIWNWESDLDIVKSSNWFSAESVLVEEYTKDLEELFGDDQELVQSLVSRDTEKKGWEKCISRDLYMSVRLFSLLKKIKAKGLDECITKHANCPSKDEAGWVKTQLKLLADHGIAAHAPGMVSNDDSKWFKQYLKDHALEQQNTIDWKPLEKGLKFKLPKSYKDFVEKAGPCSFDDVDGQEGFTAYVLEPQDFDCQSYRRGRLDADDEETNSVDGVMFARSDHGDCFCFDVRKDRKEFEVFLYLHESNCFEAYAPDYAACVRRFAAAGNGL